jgi:hypothetical protein
MKHQSSHRFAFICVLVCAATAVHAKERVVSGNTRIEVDGGDVKVSSGEVNIKVESNPDGSPKRIDCSAQRNQLKLTGQGSNLQIVGPCKRVDVATTGAMVSIDSVNTVVVSGTGNQVKAFKLDVGTITGTSNLLSWGQPLSVKQPKINSGNMTNGVNRIGQALPGAGQEDQESGDSDE